MASRRPELMSIKDSNKYFKKLLKEKKQLTKKDLIPGNTIFFAYNAKYKDEIYDKTPVSLILRRNKTHTLGLAFHWIPYNMRLSLIKYIMRVNKENIKKGKPLDFSYKDLKPRLKSLGYAPCIRLYINKRMSRNGVVISPDRLFIARLRTETFTGGRYTADQLYKKAVNKSNKRKRKK